MSGDLARLLNALALLAICVVLALAFVDQVWFGELPCPLCILQRVGFFAAGLGLALNVIFGPKPSHYGIAIVSAMAGGAIAMRQILLHIVPDTGHYGTPVLGLHLYTWSFIAFAGLIIGCALMLLDDRQFSRAEPMAVRLRALPLSVLVLFMALAIANIVSTVALCGAGFCPANPETYELFGVAN